MFEQIATQAVDKLTLPKVPFALTKSWFSLTPKSHQNRVDVTLPLLLLLIYRPFSPTAKVVKTEAFLNRQNASYYAEETLLKLAF